MPKETKPAQVEVYCCKFCDEPPKIKRTTAGKFYITCDLCQDPLTTEAHSVLSAAVAEWNVNNSPKEVHIDVPEVPPVLDTLLEYVSPVRCLVCDAILNSGSLALSFCYDPTVTKNSQGCLTGRAVEHVCPDCRTKFLAMPMLSPTTPDYVEKVLFRFFLHDITATKKTAKAKRSNQL